MNRIALAATAIVVLRQIVAQLHGMAHDELGVGLSTWQWAFVYSVVAAAPIVALVLYWTRYAAAGALLLGVSMLGGMLFGIYYHFIAVSPDNVGHLPEGHGQGFFIATAILLVPIELAGTAYGFWSWRKLRAARRANA
jgi:Na+(H+)/acetate symporter ActP